MRLHTVPAVAALCLAWSVTPAAAAQGVSSWSVDSLVKVFPSDKPKSASSKPKPAELWGARNQHVSVQLAVRSTKPLSGVTAECGPLKSSSGAAIQSVQVNPVAYVVVAANTGDVPADELVGEAPGWYPDALLEFPVDFKANRTYSIWVTIHVHADAAPGVYQGALTVRAGQRELVNAPIRLKVVSAQVPEKRSLRVTNWFTFDDRQSKFFFKAPALSPEWWTMTENIARVMGEHRQNVILTPLHMLIRGRVDGDRIRYDFSAFDRWVETFRDKGGFEFIEGGHLLDRAGGYDEPLQVPVHLVENGKVRIASLPPDDPRVEPALSEFLGALNRHLEEKNWKSVYLQHVLDEPHGSEPAYYSRFARLIRRHLPDVLTIDALDIPDAEGMPKEILDNSDIWVPQLGRFDKSVDMLQQRIKDGHEVWYYTCLFPRGRYMNRLMDYPLIKTRLLHWLNFQQNYTGFLHWGGNYWSPDPINNTQPVIGMGEEWLPSGDAFIVYPDKGRRSLYSSIRLEAMREGIEDYELLRALAQRNPEQARQIVNEALKSFTDYVRDVPTFRRIQRSLLEAASK